MRSSTPESRGVNGEATPRTFSEFCASHYFGALDGLRGLSILLVLLHHSSRFESPLLLTLQENGRHGVSFFFVISGFLICTLLLRERQRTGAVALGKFYGRRAARLLPLYYAVLAVYAFAVFALDVFSAAGEQLFRDKLPSYLFYYSNWLATSTDGPFFFAWSLAVEEQFYLGFALLLVLLPPRPLIALVGISVVVKFAVYQFVGPVDAGSTLWRIVFSYQEPILLGVLLGFALNHGPVYQRIARLLQSGVVVAAIGALLAGMLMFRPITTQSTWDAQLLFVLMTAVVAACALRPSVPVLHRGLVAHVGKVSYGIYLLHWLVLVPVARVFPDPLPCLLITFVLVVILASVVHRYFEAPIIAYFKHRSSRQAPVPSTRLMPPVPAVAPRMPVRPLTPG